MSSAPWLSIDRHAEPSKVASTDEARPVLQYGWLDHRDDKIYLCVTDSFVLAQLPVEAVAAEGAVETLLPSGSTIGLIPAALMALDNSTTGRFRIRGDGLCEIDGNDALYPIVRAGDGVGNPPAFKHLFHDEETIKNARGLKAIRVDGRKLAACSAAIGAAYDGPDTGVEVQFVGEKQAIGVRPLNGSDARGLIMPIARRNGKQ